MKTEFEATFLKINKEEIRKKLKAAGFKCVLPERKMIRKCFHFVPDIQGRWARVRDEGDKITLSVKQVIDETKIEGVEEIELVIDSFENGAAFLKACGLEEVAYQETYREKWQVPGQPIEAMIDTWPGLPAYLELEGESEAIVKEYTEKLRLNYEEAVFGSAALLYEKYLNIKQADICKYKEITFANPPRRKE